MKRELQCNSCGWVWEDWNPDPEDAECPGCGSRDVDLLPLNLD